MATALCLIVRMVDPADPVIAAIEAVAVIPVMTALGVGTIVAVYGHDNIPPGKW